MAPKWLRSALLASLVGACSSGPKPVPECKEPEPLRLVLRGSERLNPGEKGEPLATVVRVYQLKSPAKLSDAGFEEMLDKDKDVLGEDMLGVQEVTLHPGERLDPPMKRMDEATYLGVVALFRQPAGTSWRALYRLPSADPQFCHKKASGLVQMLLEENRVELR